MLLTCSGIDKSFGDKTVLSDVGFIMEERDKAALVGINGAGKTTLFRILTGELLPDGSTGTVSLAKDRKIGYLAQHQEMTGSAGIYEELLLSRQDLLNMEEEIRKTELAMKHAEGTDLEELYQKYDRLTQTFERENGYALKSEVTGILKGLGFAEADFDRPVSALSGGQKTRIALGQLLLEKPDLLILDEPTNHLDLRGIMWLETYLKTYPGAVLIASHDRYFLNALVSKVIEIENGRARVYQGNYEAYSSKKSALRQAQQKAWYKQQQEIHHQEQVIEKLKSFNREKSIKRAESREKMLDRVERVEKPRSINDEMHLSLTPELISGNDVLTVLDLTKSFPGLPLFSNISFEIHRGERIALIGDNGTGKSTMLKILNRRIPADSGTFRLGTNVEIGYYDQEVTFSDFTKTLFDEISDSYPKLTGTRIRNILAAYLFTGDEVFQRIGSLSGGERGRLSLAKLMLSKANFLILDEPTNHLDLVSKEILEDVLREYEGTVFFVSHDRYFINRVATGVLELTEQDIRIYPGNYNAYLRQKEKEAAGASVPISASSAQAASSAGGQSEGAKTGGDEKQAWLKQKEEEAAKRKKENAVKRLEDRIEELEAAMDDIDHALTDPENATNSVKLQELVEKRSEIEAETEDCMASWEALME